MATRLGDLEGVTVLFDHFPEPIRSQLCRDAAQGMREAVLAMAEQHERGSWLDPRTGELTPIEDAPYGWIIEPPDGTPRPATRDEADGDLGGRTQEMRAEPP